MSYFGLDQTQQNRELAYAAEHPIRDEGAITSGGVVDSWGVYIAIGFLLIIFAGKFYKNEASMKLIGSLIFFAISIIQIAAIIGGFHDWLGWNVVISVILAMVLTWFPLIGAVLGVMGAVHAWHWEWWQAVLLFAWPVVLMLFFGAGGVLFDKFNRR